MTPYDVRVLVIGRPASGKTAVASVIERALREAGFDQVKIEDDTIEHIRVSNEFHQKRLAAVRERNPRILIQTAQKKRLDDDFVIRSAEGSMTAYTSEEK